MVKYRLKYTKLDKMRFIGHLDLIHIFQRAIKRANLPIAFSQGFNPHQQMGFAMPLPLGMTSIGEYAEMELISHVAENQVSDTLNSQLPGGLNIIMVKILNQEEKTAAALTAAASYEIILSGAGNGLSAILSEINALDEIIVPKKTKTSLKDVNIRPDIYALEGFALKADSGEERYKIETMLSAGSGGYLKPQLLMDYILQRSGEFQIPAGISYNRLDLLMKTSKGFRPLI